MGLRTNSDSQLDPISPELALVDPELAKRARSGLELPGSSQAHAPTGTSKFARSGTLTADSAGIPADGTAHRLANPPVERSRDSDVPDPDRRRSRRRRFAFSTLAALVSAVVAVIVAARVIDRGADHNTSQANNTLSAPTMTRGSKQTGQQKAGSRPSAVRPRSAGRSHKAGQAESPAAAFQPRVFVWPGVKGALYYKVQFFRGGEEVFEALPSAPRLGLPLRWVYKGRRMRLVPGTYSWRVSPAFGSPTRPRFGDPIVRSTWVAKS